MEQEQIDHIANLLHINVNVAKDFINDMNSSQLAALVNDVSSNNVDEIKRIFKDYLKTIHNPKYDYDSEGFDESINEMNDLDNEYQIRKDYDDLKRDGKSHEEAAYLISSKYNLTTQELHNVLKGPMTEFNSEFDKPVNEALLKIEILKKDCKPNGSTILKGLNTTELQSVMSKSSPSIYEAINKILHLSADEIRESYAKLRGFNTVGILENEMELVDIQDKLLETELCSLFEATKNKWKKRMYWRQRPKNIGLGTVGVEGFDFPKINDPNHEMDVDDYGTFKKLETSDAISKYIIDHSKNK